MRRIVSIVFAAVASRPAAVVLPVAAALQIAVAAPIPASAFGFVHPDILELEHVGAVNGHFYGCYHHERLKGHGHQQANHLCSYLR